MELTFGESPLTELLAPFSGHRTSWENYASPTSVIRQQFPESPIESLVNIWVTSSNAGILTAGQNAPHEIGFRLLFFICLPQIGTLPAKPFLLVFLHLLALRVETR